MHDDLIKDDIGSTIGNIFTTVSGHQRKILKYLGPIIEKRKAALAEHGPNYSGKPVSQSSTAGSRI
jgi:hypothetical protein